MGSDEMTLRVLYEIRDGIRATNERVDGTNARLDNVNARLDDVNARLDESIERIGKVERRNERLGEQIVESEIRTATAINESTFAIREVHTLLTDRFDLRDRVERCERDIEAIKRKLE